jgi:hypothetical protein
LQPAPFIRPRLRSLEQHGECRVPERAQHARHVLQRRAFLAPLGQRPHRFSFEVEDLPAALRPEDLSEVVIAVHPDLQAGVVERQQFLELLRDGGLEVDELVDALVDLAAQQVSGCDDEFLEVRVLHRLGQERLVILAREGNVHRCRCGAEFLDVVEDLGGTLLGEEADVLVRVGLVDLVVDVADRVENVLPPIATLRDEALRDREIEVDLFVVDRALVGEVAEVGRNEVRVLGCSQHPVQL